MKIKIGHRIYDVKFGEKMHEDASILYTDNIIRVRGKQTPENERIGVLHEILHGILWTMGHELSEDESFITGFTENMFQVLKESPELIDYLKGE